MESENPKIQIRYAYPDPKVFNERYEVQDILIPSRTAINYAGASFILERAEYPESGGILRYFHGCLLPEKGYPFPQAIHAANMSKRYLLGLLRLLSKSRIMMFGAYFNLNEVIRTYNEAANLNLTPFYYNSQYPRYYCKASKEIKKFLEAFLGALGVFTDQIVNFAKAVMTLIDADSAYKYRVQDLAGETSKERLLSDFPKEMERLFVIYCEREKVDKDNMTGKMGAIVRILRFGWYVPKFRRAIKAGLNAMDWDNLIMDEGDKYHTGLWMDYKFGGVDYEKRREWFISLHDPTNPPPMIQYVRQEQPTTPK